MSHYNNFPSFTATNKCHSYCVRGLKMPLVLAVKNISFQQYLYFVGGLFKHSTNSINYNFTFNFWKGSTWQHTHCYKIFRWFGSLFRTFISCILFGSQHVHILTLHLDFRFHSYFKNDKYAIMHAYMLCLLQYRVHERERMGEGDEKH